MNPVGKYRPFSAFVLACRQWPNNVTIHAPIWCSVDLRDGNQALVTPMTVQQKVELFATLVKCGFKEIEVGFPAASPTEFAFVRRLIEESLIPEDVTIQVLVQAREDLIKSTVESLNGARGVIIHMYNSTSPAQRRIVFGLEKPQIVDLAVSGTRWVKEYSAKLDGTEVLFEYSPESFSATEVEFSREICEAVMDVWKPTSQSRIILNLPETVEVATPNIYADQIEWFCRNLSHRERAIISVHTHNDRGTGVAATELAMLAGADRVEGTLFGNGERTGNCDIIAVALNMFTQGIDPELDFSDLESIRKVYESCTGMEVPPRQPYSGDLVLTAFSGSHQDAIDKGLTEQRQLKEKAINSEIVPWDVPYLPIDPADIGRTYEKVIRVNGQSGKSGISHILESECSIHMPKEMQREFGAIAGKAIDALGREATSADLMAMFQQEYIERKTPYRFVDLRATKEGNSYFCYPVIWCGDKQPYLRGVGNGPIDAFVNALQSDGIHVSVLNQYEHALGQGQDASAIGYVQLQFTDGSKHWGAGVDTDVAIASIKAVISALNRHS